MLAEMPPIDFAQLALDRQTPHRSTAAQLAKFRATRARNAKRKLRIRKREAAKRIKAEVMARRAHQTNIKGRILAAMVPGQWYGKPDIRVAAGIKRNSAHQVILRLERAGMIERARNEDYRPIVYRKGAGIDWQARGRDCEWLYRLTAAGELKRASEPLNDDARHEAGHAVDMSFLD